MTDDSALKIRHCPPAIIYYECWPGLMDGARQLGELIIYPRGDLPFWSEHNSVCNIHQNRHVERNISHAGFAANKKKSHSFKSQLTDPQYKETLTMGLHRHCVWKKCVFQRSMMSHLPHEATQSCYLKCLASE